MAFAASPVLGDGEERLLLWCLCRQDSSLVSFDAYQNRPRMKQKNISKALTLDDVCVGGKRLLFSSSVTFLTMWGDI